MVAFNAAAPRAYLTDTNVHIIRLYSELASGALTSSAVRQYLEHEGARLAAGGNEYYYEVRNRFNTSPTSLDSLFLNRSCFNGVIRFNRKGYFNVPFNKKPDRFRPAYVTKIVNQVAHLSRVMYGKDWKFEASDWRSTLEKVEPGDFVYADPPYWGRHTDYFENWTENDADDLLSQLLSLPSGFALSTWLENKYRRNPHLERSLEGVELRTHQHFYHVGATEDLRNAVTEALIVKLGHASAP